ncbi:MAG TPA: Mur ligase family protein [Actinomycetota bacterium]|nr:Mur ligase family protein [Actinomycetota bacterium]
MRFADALAELDTRQPEHMPEPDLDRISALAALLDDPQLTYPTIHVTGTNGKTTTARLVTALACEHGLSTGLFTSPHLTSVTERFVVCVERMREEEFGEEYGHLVPYLETVDERVGRVTYFEALTALAYLWFADKPVGLGVFEVGMGGEWDATNLVAGDVAVLCPIAMDHVAVLGPTLADIAREKAGIVKQGKVAVVREQAPEALAVIRDRCEGFIASMVLEGREWALESRVPAVGGQALTVHGLGATYEDLVLPIHGEHAAHSAAAAVAALEALLERPLDAEAIRRAFARAVVPGRLEVIARHPLIVLDGAHNPAAAEALAAALPETFSWDRLRLVAGVFTNKDLDGIAERLAPLADQVYACATPSVRARLPSEVADAFGRNGVPARAFPDVREALDAARADAREGDLILVTGSLYTVADARRALVAGAPPEVRGRGSAQEEP